MRFRCNTIYINIKSPSLPFLSAAQVPWHPTAGWSFGWRASRRCPWFQLVSAGFRRRKRLVIYLRILLIKRNNLVHLVKKEKQLVILVIWPSNRVEIGLTKPAVL